MVGTGLFADGAVHPIRSQTRKQKKQDDAGCVLLIAQLWPRNPIGMFWLHVPSPCTGAPCPAIGNRN
eukprot:5895718-Amphidinium_carterae.1